MLSEEENAFVRASEELAGAHERELVRTADTQRRANRRLRRLFALTASLLVIAVIAAAVDVRLRRKADATATVATARELGAQAVTTGRLDVATLLAAQAAKLDPGPQSRGALLAVLSRAPRATRVLSGTGQRILTVAVGGAGPRTVAIDRRGVVAVFDVSTGARLNLPAGVGNVNGAAFSPDGRTLALGGGDASHPGGHVYFLDAQTLRLAGAAAATTSAVDALSYTADGRQLGILSDDGSAHLLDATTGAVNDQPLATGVRHPSAISFDESTKWMLTLGTAEVRAVGSPSPLPLPSGYPGALSPDGATVAIANANQILLVNRETAKVVRTLAGHSAPIEALSYSADGKLLASVADDGLAIVWDVATGARVADLTGHAGRVNAVAFSPDDHTVVTGGFDGRLVAWNLSAPSSFGAQAGSLASIPGADGLADGYAAMSAATDRVLVGEPGGTVVIARADGHVVGSFVAAHHGDVNDAELSRDGQLGATVGSDSTIRVWDVVAGGPFQAVPVIHTAAPPASVALSADHRLVAWGDVTGTLTMASLADGHVLWRQRLDAAATADAGAITLLAFSPDDRSVAANVLHVATELVPADGTGSPQVLHAADNNAWAIAFSPDGRRLVTGDADGSAQLWNLHTGATIDLGPTEAAASADISGAAFDPSGYSFATWALDGSVQLWDAQAGQAVGPPLVDPQDGAVMAASWRNAAELTTFHSGGPVLNLQLREAGLVEHACALAGRKLSTQEWSHYLPGRPYRPACTQ
jgi:WD40 repeat protein